jgi:hypothetical protein
MESPYQFSDGVRVHSYCRAHNDRGQRGSSIFGLRMNHNSFVGGRTVSWIEAFGQFLMQSAQITQFALDVMFLGNSNNGQPGAFSVPL